MSGWVTFWGVVLTIGLGCFVLTVVIAIPWGAINIREYLRNLADSQEDRS